MKNGAKMSARGSPNGDQNRGISWTFRNPLPGALQGWFWGGFWMDLGTFWEGFGGILDDFGMIFNEIWEGF